MAYDVGGKAVDEIEGNLRGVAEMVKKLREENAALSAKLAMREKQIAQQYDDVFAPKADCEKPPARH